jgi:predicted TPR repeat methyltransferase
VSDASNDILADRRFAWAKQLAAEGDHAAAADLLEQVIEIAPGSAPAWAALGEARERSGTPDTARAAWPRAAALDPEGRLGADLRLARLEGRTPDAMPATYVRALFDDYAPHFERHLVDGLAYRGPELLVAALDAAVPGRRFGRALDLGCGTGLMGRALAGRAARIDGVDIAPRMIDVARRSGAYAMLTVASLDEAVAAAPEGTFDLITAADVLVYLGDLSSVFASIARVLTPGGLFAFTAQRCHAGGHAFGADLRFAHSPGCIETALAGAGLLTEQLDALWARRENGRPVPGLVGVAHRR